MNVHVENIKLDNIETIDRANEIVKEHYSFLTEAQKDLLMEHFEFFFQEGVDIAVRSALPKILDQMTGRKTEVHSMPELQTGKDRVMAVTDKSKFN